MLSLSQKWTSVSPCRTAANVNDLFYEIARKLPKAGPVPRIYSPPPAFGTLVSSELNGVLLVLSLTPHAGFAREDLALPETGVAALGSLVGRLGASLGSLAGDLGAVLGSLAGDMGAALGSLAGSLGAALGSLAGDLGAALGSLAGDLGSLSGAGQAGPPLHRL